MEHLYKLSFVGGEGMDPLHPFGRPSWPVRAKGKPLAILGQRAGGVAEHRLSAQMISRSDGRNIVAAVACRAGAELANDRNGQAYDSTRKGSVLHMEIVAPAPAPA
jgi:hypothetical protein